MRQKLKTMVTDPARIRRTDPGNPDMCPVGDLHKIFSSAETMAKVDEGCTTAGIGCIECKGWAADGIVARTEPHPGAAPQIRSKSQAGMGYSRRRIGEGACCCRGNLVEARDAMNMSHEYQPPEQRRAEVAR